MKTVHLLGGPVAFLLLLLVPGSWLDYPVRGSLGLLLWMSWWWIFEPVNLAVTGFLPLVVLAIFNFLPVARILPSYSEELIFLLLGANILSTVWTRWGLDRRIALVSLIGVGTGTRRQIMVWFAIATILSAFLPNTVVAATMIPIVLAMLRFIGIEDISKSTFGSALVIAIAWGTSVGGFWTPLGGAPNLLTIKLLQQTVISHEFLFMTWVTRLLPLTIVIAAVSFAFMWFAFTPEIEHVEGSRNYFALELRSLGKMTAPEAWGLSFFLAATLLAFTRQFYASLLPGLNPAFVFLTFAVLCFAIRHNGEPLLKWDYAQKHMQWGLFYLFAGGAALGEILSQTGTAKHRRRHADSICGRRRISGRARVLADDDGRDADYEQHRGDWHHGADHDQHVSKPRHESHTVRLHCHGRRQLRCDAAVVGGRSSRRGRVRRQSQDDVFARLLAGRPALGRHRRDGVRVSDLLAGIWYRLRRFEPLSTQGFCSPKDAHRIACCVSFARISAGLPAAPQWLRQSSARSLRS